ncbi:MAG: PAS domain S-box protein, partial [Nitrospirota bacterium]
MDYFKKTRAKLIEEIQHQQGQINRLEDSLKVLLEESAKRVDTIETSHAYLQTVIDNIGDLVLVIDPKYKVTLANRRVMELYGGTDPVKKGLYCYQVSHHRNKPCSGGKDPCPLKKILKTKSSVTLTHTHHDSKGNKILVEINATPILNNAGEVAFIIEACRDITGRTSMEKALLESEMRYRSLFEQSSDAIFILDTKSPNTGKILSANKAACRMHGYTKKELLGLNIT